MPVRSFVSIMNTFAWLRVQQTLLYCTPPLLQDLKKNSQPFASLNHLQLLIKLQCLPAKFFIILENIPRHHALPLAQGHMGLLLAFGSIAKTLESSSD